MSVPREIFQTAGISILSIAAYQLLRILFHPSLDNGPAFYLFLLSFGVAFLFLAHTRIASTRTGKFTCKSLTEELERQVRDLEEFSLPAAQWKRAHRCECLCPRNPDYGPCPEFQGTPEFERQRQAGIVVFAVEARCVTCDHSLLCHFNPRYVRNRWYNTPTGRGDKASEPRP